MVLRPQNGLLWHSHSKPAGIGALTFRRCRAAGKQQGPQIFKTSQGELVTGCMHDCVLAGCLYEALGSLQVQQQGV